MITISEQHLHAHLSTLAGEIGVRLAGTPGEQAAAEYIAREFEAAGAQVRTETFPVNARCAFTTMRRRPFGSSFTLIAGATPTAILRLARLPVCAW